MILVLSPKLKRVVDWKLNLSICHFREIHLTFKHRCYSGVKGQKSYFREMKLENKYITMKTSDTFTLPPPLQFSCSSLILSF